MWWILASCCCREEVRTQQFSVLVDVIPVLDVTFRSFAGNGVLEDSESVTLLETGATTNVFTAAFPTRLLQPTGTATSFDSELQTSLGAEIALQYDEAYPQGRRTIATTSQHLAEIDFEFRFDVDSSFLDITLIDYNLAATASVDCHIVAPLDQETVVLGSTGVGTFTFTGSILVLSTQVHRSSLTTSSRS